MTLLGPVVVGPVAHGGHCVARWPDAADADHAGERRVIFVRHALPGETVMIMITDDQHDRFWRGDAVEVITASPDRVTPTCPVSGPGGCGGCDFQHVAPPAQRQLKAAVVAEQLHRLAGIEVPVEVEEVRHPDVVEGRGWRTRVQWVADDQGRPGLRAHRSHDVVVPPTGCELASSRLPDPGDPAEAWAPGTEVGAVVGGADRATSALVSGRRVLTGDPVIIEHAAGQDWTVDATGFWQVHPAAADTLVAAVLAGLEPRPGERAFDLYCGVGLFAGALSAHGVRVWGVESDPSAIAHARSNVGEARGAAGSSAAARFTAGRVERVLPRLPRRTDLVVLDPPRAGAGRRVMTEVTRREPRAIAYVACDPAALARDLGTAAGLGYRLATLRAFDLFPMTHHVECVAVLVPG